MADLRIAQGRLHEAAHICEEALQLAAAQSEPVVQGTADLHLRLSQLNREWGKPEAAREHFRTAEQIGKQAPMPDWKHDLHLARARIQADEGDLDGALKWLDAAARLHTRGPAPDLRPIGAQEARVWIRQGRLSAALDWARKRGLSVDDDLSYLRAFEHLTLARLLIARNGGGRHIQKALTPAARKIPPHRRYPTPQRPHRRLLAAFERGETTPPDAQRLIEPLTPRELDVLQFIAEGLSNQQISGRLDINLQVSSAGRA